MQQWREPGLSVCAHVCMQVRAGGEAGVGRALEARFRASVLRLCTSSWGESPCWAWKTPRPGGARDAED